MGFFTLESFLKKEKPWINIYELRRSSAYRLYFSVRRFNKPGVKSQEKIIIFGYPCIYMFNVLTINPRVVKVLAAILYAVSELTCSNVFGKD